MRSQGRLEVLLLLLRPAGVFSSNDSCLPLPTITFGQSVPLTGFNAINGIPYKEGILAAITEYNAETSLDKKFKLAVQVKDDAYDPAIAAANMQAFANDPTILAVLGMTGTDSIEAAAPFAVQHRLPLLAAYGGMKFRRPFRREIINFRASFLDETAAVVEFLLSNAKNQITLYYQNDALGFSALEGFQIALDSNNRYLHSNVTFSGPYVGNLATWTAEADSAIAFINSSHCGLPPDAIVLAGANQQAMSVFIQKAVALWPDVMVVCLNAVAITTFMALFIPLPNAAALFKNLYSSQFVPVPYNYTTSVARSFKGAADLAKVSATRFTSFEAYLIGRLAIAALHSIRGFNYTSERLMQAIYNNSYFTLDGMRVGPFDAAEVEGGCNQGVRKVYVMKSFINKTVSEVFSYSVTGCGYQPKTWQRLRFGQSCSFTGSQSNLCQGFHDGVLAAFKQVNDAGGIRGTTRLVLETMDDESNETQALINNMAFLDDPRIVGLIGASPLGMDRLVPMLRQSDKVLIGAFSGDVLLRVPFQRNIINFRASVEDEMSALVHHCYQDKKNSRFSVLYEATPYGRSGKAHITAAIAEKRWEIFTEAAFDDQNLTYAINHVLNAGGVTPDKVLVIGLADSFVDILVGIHGQHPEITVFGSSKTVMNDKLSEPSVQARINLKNVHLTAVVPPLGNSSVPVVHQYKTALSQLDARMAPSAAGFEGYLVGQLLATSLGRIMSKELTMTNMLEAIYENGNFNLHGMHCGPFSDGTVDVAVKSCNQCMKKVYFITLTNEIIAPFAFDGDCMYTLSSNVDFDLRGSRLVMLVVAGLGIAVTMLIIVLLVIYRNDVHVKSTSWRFSVVSCFGGILCYLAIFAFYPVPTDWSCGLVLWITDVAFVTLFGPIFAKTYRIDKIFNNKKLSHRSISDFQVLQVVLVVAGLFLCLLVPYTIMSRPYMKEAFTAGGARYEKCVTDNDIFRSIDLILKGFVLLWGTFLCQRVYKIDGQFARFNESKQLVACIYHTTFLGVCLLLLGLTTKEDPNLDFMVTSALLLENTFLVVLVLYGHPVFKAVMKVSVHLDASTHEGSSVHNSVKHMSKQRLSVTNMVVTAKITTEFSTTPQALTVPKQTFHKELPGGD